MYYFVDDNRLLYESDSPVPQGCTPLTKTEYELLIQEQLKEAEALAQEEQLNITEDKA